MRVAFVYDAVFPWEKGGAQKRVWELAKRLTGDHDVHLYGMHYWDGPAVMERDGITYHGVCEPGELYVEGRRSIPQAIRFARKLARPLLAERFDIVDCQQSPYFPVFPAKAHELVRRSNLVVTWYEVWDDYWYDYLGRKGVFGKSVERLAVRLPRTIIPISEAIREDLVSFGRRKGLEVVPNGVDFQGLQEIPRADTDWDVIYVGRLAEHKNVDVLLNAIARASDRLGREVQTCIIGDGPERERLERHAVSVGVGDTVSFLGFVEADEDVIGHLKAATVFVLPSTREGFPNTILEANGCGVPSIVISHPENGATAVVEDGETGYVTEFSADAIADRIATVVSAKAERDRLSSGALKFAEAHDWDVIVDQLTRVYSKVVDE